MAKTKTAKRTAKKAPQKKATPKKATQKATVKKTTAKSTKKPPAKKKKAKTTRQKVTKTPDDEVTIDRRRGERRLAAGEIVAEDNQQVPSADAKKPQPERRKKAPRRRQIDPTTCERDYSDEEIEFMHALDEYKRANGRMFPTCSEILEVVRDLGYAKVEKQESTDQLQLEAGGTDTTTGVEGATGSEFTSPAVDASGSEPTALPTVDLSTEFTDTSGIHSF